MTAVAPTIREYRPDDEIAVLRLLEMALGSGRAFDRTSAFWRWKHFENPFGPSLMMLAANGEVCGLRAFLRWRFRAADRTIRAIRAVDTATHPDYRRLGVFSSLTRQTVDRARDEGVDLIFNTPNPISLRGYLKLGWTLVGRPSLLVRPVRPLRIARALLGRGHLESGADAVQSPAVPAGEWLRGDVDALLEQDDRQRAGWIRTSRSADYLRWRYARVPSLAYFACWLGGHHALEAAVIFRCHRRRGLREVRLCEVLVRRASGQVPALVRRVLAAADADYLVAYAPRRSAHWWGLVRAGFVPVPRIGPFFTVRPLTPAGAEISPERLGRWSLSLGDLELF
ncbi:MAG: GNAT family N-acetyltransferase [Armatimonadota bacterium]|nr:GNAT family N-acetyltransferase [Armatimonadota bacterium]